MKLRAFVLAAAVVGAGCFLSTEPEGGLTLSMQLNTTHVRSDSALVVVLTAVNATSHLIPYNPSCRLLSLTLVPPGGGGVPHG